MICNMRLADNESISFQFDAPVAEGYVIGRADEALHYMPDIDLADYDSRDKGVSRRHAALVDYEGIPHLIDLYSANGTYLNGKRLSPDRPYALEAINEVRLGTLDLIITVS
jgi:pSer/pThr/pTyr-binding forkhead associated (FHA) protein